MTAVGETDNTGRILVASPDMGILIQISGRLENSTDVIFAVSAMEIRRAVGGRAIRAVLADPALLRGEDELLADLGLRGVPVVWLRRPLVSNCLRALASLGVPAAGRPRGLFRAIKVRAEGLWRRFRGFRFGAAGKPAAGRTAIPG